jgi:hypothetical protein
VVIGIGETASAVLRQLRQRLNREFGDEPLAAVQFLLLDSDPKTIARAMQGDERSALKPAETLALPLRRPQEYRENSGKLLRWLSRRWLYNIPKSLQTEGLRPLGRLAFADHARQAVQRIRMALAQATDAESVRGSSEQTSIEFRAGAIRVYLVTSISGGSGSGMSLDVAYAVRIALQKAGLDDAHVVGILTHSSGHDPRKCDLARVNAYAWITEYNHFHRPGGQFCGDECCGLPPCEQGQPAFDAAYLLDVGAEQTEGNWETATQSIAEYIYLDAFTPAQAFFDACREQSPAGCQGTAPLRTFHLEKIAATADTSIESAAAALSRQVALRWVSGGEPEAATPSSTGSDSLSDTNQLVHGAAQLVSRSQLKLEGMASNARTLIESQYGGDQQAFIENLIQLARQDGSAAGPAEMVRIVDCLFAAEGQQAQSAFVLQRPLEAIVSPLNLKLAGDLARWVLQKLDDRQSRLSGAQRAANWIIDHLNRVVADATRLTAAMQKQIALTAEELRTGGGQEENWERAVGYFRMRTDEHAVLASAIIARRLLAQMKSVVDTITEFGRHLKHVATHLAQPSAPISANDPLAKAVAESFATLIDAVDQQLQDKFISPNGGLFQTIMGNSRLRAQMLQELNRYARQAVEQFASRPEVARAALTGEKKSVSESAVSSEHQSPLLEHGGAYRTLAVLPSHAQSDADNSFANATIVSDHGNNIVTCQEAWDLPLTSIAMDIIQRRRDYADFAARVASRSDVQWTPLNVPTVQFPIVVPTDEFAAAMPMATQVL